VSFFEAAMLFCFGFAWPLTIYRSYKSGTNAGKSLPFLYVVFFGYVSGTLHKIIYNFDPVIILYILNGLMVLIDIMLYYRNKRLPVNSAE
jgi:lipopolysaccharide export LptBFGC system permease protein LptF